MDFQDLLDYVFQEIGLSLQKNEARCFIFVVCLLYSSIFLLRHHQQLYNDGEPG